MGIPDYVFVLGTDAIGVVLSRISMQPFLVIAARLCPAGCEAALYAFFMSTYNFGNTISGIWGAAITPYFGVDRENLDNLPQILLLRTACTLLPLLFLKPLLGSVDKTNANKSKTE
eukprot:CAMPEP_0194160004 /NCGR_PEP_ID=MMETSP0152-20130528/78147_1 /TAXON_ID=1049557 /ORGANISM="Thalassiothrix antarctica, Strain L6-D1" /LENGTH=115 /DNA_ID=CAMNT_0038869639 /DNA_START=526 /DNA_END=873 /DNA_ORIENTATION=-